MNFNIIICAYNEYDNLKDLIPCLLKTSFQNNLNELIVVSSGSTDRTDELISNYKNEFNGRQKNVLKLITEPDKRGKYSAINLALKNCKEVDALIFLSADVFPARGSIDSLINFFSDPTVGCVTGRPLPKNWNNSIISQIGAIAWRLHNSVMRENYERGTLWHAGGDMIAFRYGIFNEMPKLINDDAWMAMTTYKKGYKLVYNSQAIVYIHTPETFNDWINQRIRIDRGHYQLLSRGLHPQVLSFMPIGKRLKIILKDILREKSFVPMIMLMLLELYVKFKSRNEKSAQENWQRIDSTKNGFKMD